MKSHGALMALLVLLGAGWGLTQPLAKIAVSTGHGPFGLIFWQLLIGALVLGAVQLALLSGQWIDPRAGLGAPELALMASSIIHAAVYASYVWLVGRAGATFAAQVSYLVTGFGMFWAMVLLGESYGGAIWGALALMFAGLFLVRPHPR